MASESSGTRTGRRRRRILDLSGPVLSGGGDDEEGEGEVSSTFLSAVWDQGYQASQKEEQGVDIFEALEMKAQAASMAGKAMKQKKVIKAKFGGTKASIAGVGGDVEDIDGLDSLELEFLREIEENAALTFVQPTAADYHDDDNEEDGGNVRFTTEELWEDIDYEQRKKEAVEKLKSASETLNKAQINLPKLKVENKRLEQDISTWQRDIEELDKKQKKMLKKFPELAKQAKDVGTTGEVNEAGPDGLSEEVRRARAKEEERVRQRTMRRRKQLDLGLQQVEEFEVEQDMMWIPAVPWRKRAKLEFQRAKETVMIYFAFLDPYRFAINQLKRLSPRTVVYFESLRWLNLSTYLTVLVAIPQILTWTAFSSIWPLGGSGTVIIPKYFLYSFIPHELHGTNLSLLFCILFAAVYAIIAAAILNRLYGDMVEYFKTQVSQSDQHPYKYSSVVFSGLNFKVLTKAQQFSFAMETQSSLRLFLAQQKEEKITAEDGNLAEFMDKSTLMLHRIGGFLLISCITVGVWVMIELFFPQEMLLYPFGWERLIPPGLSSFYNHFIVPVSTRMVVSFGHYKKSQRTVALLFLSLYGRFVNIVIILRKQYKSIMDPSRVLRLDRMPDVCFCEDGVGVNFLLFWSMDWIMSNLAVVLIPLIVGVFRRISPPEKKDQGATGRPEFEMGSWLMDIVSSQALFLMCLPFMPAISALRIVTGIIQFFLHQKVILNFWIASTKGAYNPVLLRVTDVLCQFFALELATVVYYYIWVYGSTELLQAPICKLPLLYYNITHNLPCNYDATTGDETTVACNIYETNNPCEGRDFSMSNFALFAWQTPSAIIGAYFKNVVNVVGAPVFPWFVMLLALIVLSIQRDFRQKFQRYVEEERYRLLAAIANLERTMKKKEKLLAIQNLE